MHIYIVRVIYASRKNAKEMKEERRREGGKEARQDGRKTECGWKEGKTK